MTTRQSNAAAALDAEVATFNPDVVAAQVAADREVAPSGFTVRRFRDQVVVQHNATTRTFTFTRGSDSFHWNCPVGNHGDTHRNTGERSFEFHDRFVARCADAASDPQVWAVAWFRQAEASDQAFTRR